MARKPTRVYASKKNSGLEVTLEFYYQHHTELTSVDKIRVELWLKQQAGTILSAFRSEFPNIENGDTP